MDILNKAKFNIDALCVFNLKEKLSPVKALLEEAKGDGAVNAYSEFIKELSDGKSLKQYISGLIFTDDNLFSRAAASGKDTELSKAVIQGVKSDLERLEELSALTAEDIINNADSDAARILKTLPKWETGEAEYPFKDGWHRQLDGLAAYYRENGYGDFSKYCAFSWRDGALAPIKSPSPITLGDLKNYDRQKTQVVDNTVAFLKGLPANNVLLYGDRGTGKSSTVHAVLNEYRAQKLRMIEISKNDISRLGEIRELLADSPMKFIIFIDDLSFDSHDDDFAELKAALEGSLSGVQSNMLIYATSNRRHLIKENFSDREDDVHRSDTLQEELSLSDRFGLSIYYENPKKSDYLDIAVKIAKDRGLAVDLEKYTGGAELWAQRRGGRSPRCAKQFADYVEGCIKQGIKW